MIDKVQKIREEVQKIARSINPYIPDDEGKNSEYEAGRFAMVTQIMQIIDSLQKEPKSKFEQSIQEGDNIVYNEELGCRVNLSQLKRVAKKEETVSEDLEEEIKNYDKWQKEQMMRDAKSGIGNNDNYIQFEDGTWIDFRPFNAAKVRL